MDRSQLEKFLLFVTGGDLLLDEIKVYFTKHTPRSPHSSTCSRTLFLDIDYSCYNDLAAEFNNVLNNLETFRFYSDNS